MADPRRSARSTKGVNSRLSELNVIETPSPAPKRRKSTPKEVVDEPAIIATEEGKPDDIIRCVCGANEEDEDDDRMMIQCEGCDAWQHTQCMGISKKKIPKQYFCEICNPELHSILLSQLELGEKPWERKIGGRRKRALAKPKDDVAPVVPVTPARDSRRGAATTSKAEKSAASVTPAPPKTPAKAAFPVPETVKKSARKGSKKEVRKEVPKEEGGKKEVHKEIRKEIHKEVQKEKVEKGAEKEVAKQEIAQEVTENVTKAVTEDVEKPVHEEDKMDVDSVETQPSAAPVSPPATTSTPTAPSAPSPPSAPSEPSHGNGEKQLDRIDHDATIPMEDVNMPPPPLPASVESQPPKSHANSLPSPVLAKGAGELRIVTDSSALGSRSSRTTGEKTNPPKTPAKRKSSSDGEHKDKAGKQHRAVKLDTEPRQEQPPPQKKQRKVSTAAAAPPATPRRKSSAASTKPPPTARKPKPKDDTTPQCELVSSISELRNTNRQNVVKWIKKCMTDHAKRLVDEKKITLQPGSTVDSLVENRALQVEYHVYMKHFSGGQIKQEYQKRSKSIASNLKSNASLSDKILGGQLSCERLANMTTEEMASKELKELMQQVRRESEKQHTLINDSGPRIRRTHKGEELVNEDNSQSAQDTLLDSSTVIRRHSETTEDVPAPVVPAAPSPTVHSPAQASICPPTVATISEPPRSPSQASPAEGSASTAEKKSFNIQKVWSHVESPDTDRRPRLPSTSRAPPPVNPAQNKIDKDIDMLLKDDDAGTPPYSPASFNDHYSPKADHDDDSVWRGTISMSQIADLNATATLLGGPERIGEKRWLELVDPVLNIDGRIKHERATEYLCGQKFSKSSTMILASLKPAHSSNQAVFNKLFDYFKKKERYAVVGKHELPCIKDLYIVPIDKDEKLPDWFSVVDPPTKVTEYGRGERMLVLIFVVIRSLVLGNPAENTNGNVPAPSVARRLSMQGTPVPGSSFGTPAQPQPSPFAPGPPLQSPVPPLQTPVPPLQSPIPNHQNHNRSYQGSPLPQYPQAAYSYYQQHSYPSHAPTPPPHLPSPQPHHLPAHGYVPQHAMTRELINMLPKLSERQLRAIDELLHQKPDLETRPERLAEEVEKVLGPDTS
ncbi:transcription factor S-II, central domain-containing protein [Sphaerosporella brunnea]|uniref:Transcription factor BYE1 n=1 Tax=Sphaerosporella brunnea TaxID=1250544 RepID=A0A5J5F214_9PEZI|nr:transcription factor S-II, central domain-containing protein [Sphaerosporella brunnea]